MKLAFLRIAPLLAIAGVANDGLAAEVFAPDNLGTTNAATIGDRIIKFDTANPLASVVTVGQTGIANIGMSGMDFSGGGTLFAVSGFGSAFVSSDLFRIDIATGAATLVGNLGLPAGQDATDLAWNPVEHRMQVLASAGGGAGATQALYTVNLITGAATPVGPIAGLPASTLEIGLSTDSNGINYIHDLVTDRMYVLAGLVAAPMAATIGIDTNFSQGMTMDWSRNDTWFLGSLSTSPVNASQVRLMDPATGGTMSVLATWPNNGAGGLPQYETGDLAIAPKLNELLLVLDSTNDKALAFSPIDGSLVNPNFIPADPAHLSTPKGVCDSTRGTILVSDQVNGDIVEYGYDGSFIQVLVDDIAASIDNIRGIAVHQGRLYATVDGPTGGPNIHTIQRFNLDGTGQFTWATVANQSVAGVGNPFDILFVGSEALVVEINGDDIHRYDLSGTFLGLFHNSDGIAGVDFPEQIQAGPGSTVLCAGFSAPIGVYQYDSTGAQTAFWPVGTGNRGVYALRDGNILYTDGNSVTIFDRATATQRDVATGGAYHFAGYTPLNYLVNPDAVAVAPGSILAGNVASLASDDGDELRMRPGPVLIATQFPIVMTVTSTAPITTASTMLFNIERRANVSVNEKVELFNYQSASYVQMGGLNPVFGNAVLTVQVPNDKQFISSTGEVRARISYKNAGAVLVYPWNVFVDRVEWRIRP